MTMNVADGFIIYAADPARKEDACKLAARTGAVVTDDADTSALENAEVTTAAP